MWFSAVSPSLLRGSRVLLFILRPCMSPYYYLSPSVSAGRPDRRVKKITLGAGGIHSAMSFWLWRFLLSDMRMSFLCMSPQDSSVWAQKIEILKPNSHCFFTFFRSHSLAPRRSLLSFFSRPTPFSCQFPIVFPHSEAAVITRSKLGFTARFPQFFNRSSSIFGL